MFLSSLALLVNLSLIQAPQAATFPTPGELAAMKKLDFLVGTWEGEGWLQRGPTKETYKARETVQIKLQGKAVMVEGLHRNASSGVIVHDTLGVITFDEKSATYKLNTYLFNRPNAEFELKVLDGGFTWQMKQPGDIVIDYIMRLENGEWFEYGEVNMPGRPKMRFLEMRLKKVEK